MGIFIDDKITWKPHIDHIISKLFKTSGILYKVGNLINTDTLILLHNSIVYPYLHYCNLVWGMAHNTALKPIRIVQYSKMIRLIANANFDAHTQELFKQLKLLNINDIYSLECLKSIHDTVQSNTGSLQTAADIHTRNRQQSRPAFPNTEAQKRFVSCHGCTLWNNLPDNFKKLP